MKQDYYEKIRRINGLSNDMNMAYHQAAWKLGVSDSVLCVLYVIYEKGNHCLLQDICNESGIRKQTINSAIRKLESEEILYLEKDKGKNKRVCLTEKGQQYVLQTAARLYEAECNVFNEWEEEEFETYLRLMKKYNDSFRQQIEKWED